MFKLIGFLCIMVGCMGWGEGMVREEKNRVRHLGELIRIIGRIQDEMRYGKRTLPEICLILSEYGDSWYADHFRQMYEQLRRQEGTDLESVWGRQMELCFQGVPLHEEEKDVLRRLPEKLGLQEETLQAAAIGQSVDMLVRKCRQAEEAYAGKVKVIRSVSILTGLFLTILLI
ncbi:MAG: stage III sporulation protein AB [Clostridiales bacterium]|nr:stage III sporulation protein AB [Clostridiales bacterium]